MKSFTAFFMSNGNPYDKLAALAQLALHFDLAPVKFHQVLRQGQSQSRAFFGLGWITM